MYYRLCLLVAMLTLLASWSFAAQPTDAALKQVNDMIGAIDLANPPTIDVAEESLVKGGVDLLPAIKFVLAQRQQALKEAESGEPQRQLGDVPLLQTQIDVLDRAVIRLTWKINPPKLIEAWVGSHVAMKSFFATPRPMRIMDERLASSFPRFLFYVMRFRQFPVARMVPAPLSANNVFVVGKDGVVQLIVDTPTLKSFYQASLHLTSSKDRKMSTADAVAKMKDAVYSWLRIAQELVNDGMLSFTIPEKTLTAEMAVAGLQPAKWIVNGEADVVATGGNGGSVKVTMWFDPKDLSLQDVQETDNVQAGIRPICQATKLLDTDPIVRRMAEQDLLFMGTAGECYIMEQRAKATPELQAAIDGMWARIVAKEAGRGNQRKP